MTAAVQGFILDLDGTVYLGEEALPGAVDAIAELRRMDRRILYVTNKPLHPRESYAAKLTRLGIPTHPEDIITSGSVLTSYLSRNLPGLAYYVIGEENLKDEMRSAGLAVLPEFLEQDARGVIDASSVDAVVIAFDRTLDYRKMNTAYQALLLGARFIATNPDRMCPMPGGGIPDAGATIAALEWITGRRLEILAGKPSPIMMSVAAEVLGLPAEQCIMVGDRLATDIRMGFKAGMHTAIVLTGETTRQDCENADPKPEYTAENLLDLIHRLFSDM